MPRIKPYAQWSSGGTFLFVLMVAIPAVRKVQVTLRDRAYNKKMTPFWEEKEKKRQERFSAWFEAKKKKDMERLGLTVFIIPAGFVSFYLTKKQLDSSRRIEMKERRKKKTERRNRMKEIKLEES